MAGEPGRGLSGVTTVLAAQVVTFDMSGSGAVNRCGAALRTCTDVEGGKLERGELALC
jgi:hypothetical protein